MTELLQTGRSSTLLGLAFDGRTLRGALLRRSNGSADVPKRFSVPVPADLLKADLVLLGRELRKALDAAGIRERRCVVCLPAEWALSVFTQLPDLPEADQESFLQLEAERGFPYAPESILVCRSQGQSGPARFVLQMAIPRENLGCVETLLRAARLVPASMTLGILALQPADAPGAAGTVTLALGQQSVGLKLNCGGGVAALRNIAGPPEPESIVRELRITLGQLPPALREEIHSIQIFGEPSTVQPVVGELQTRLDRFGLEVGCAGELDAAALGLGLPPGQIAAAEVNLAARVLAGRPTGQEFLAPRLPVWRQAFQRYSSRRLRTAAALGGAILVLTALPFAIQQWQLVRLEARWRMISPRVLELEHLQQQNRHFRPWFDERARSLSILRALSEAFPEDSSVSARTLELREPGSVSCSGIARDQEALLKTLDRLRASPEVAGLKVDQMRGRSPMQFTFNFQWNPGGNREP